MLMPSKTVHAPGQGGLGLVGGRFDPPVYKTVGWRPPDINILPSWAGVKRLGLDTETKDPDIRTLGPGVRRPGNRMVGISFALEDPANPAAPAPKYYLPFGHEGGDNLPPAAVLGYIRDQFKNFDGDVVGANLSYDLDWLWSAKVEMPKVRRFRDVLVADPLIFELHDQYSLEEVSKRRGFEGKDEDALRDAARQYKLDPKKDLWRLPARHVGPYAEEDAALPLAVLRHQEVDIESQGLAECWDMESRLLPVLVRMTRRGVVVDVDRLDQIEAWTKIKEQEAYDIIHRETGVRFPIGASMNVDLCTQALRAAGLDEFIGETSKGDSVTRGGLTMCKHPVADAINKARNVSKVRGTYINGVREHMITRSDGETRIHCNFNQIRKTDDEAGDSGVAYGRLSTGHVNMQNQPSTSRSAPGDETGTMWRSTYRPNKGQTWTACDLKQQEPKWSFHYGALLEERGFEQARGALDLCRRLTENPMLDTYEPIVEAAGVTRGTAKIIWLARAYGKSDGNLCGDPPPTGFGLPTYQGIYDRQAGRPISVDSDRGRELLRNRNAFSYRCPGPEGAELIRKVDEAVPFLRFAAKKAKETADDRGYVMLLSGRRCHFDKKEGRSGYEWTHKAFNRIIQGTSAEQMKRVMLAVSDGGFDEHLLLQVHDELDFSLPDPEMAAPIKEIMRTAVPMKMPTIVDLEQGPTWGESMGLEYINSAGKKLKVPYKWGLVIEGGEPVYRDGVV